MSTRRRHGLAAAALLALAGCSRPAAPGPATPPTAAPTPPRPRKFTPPADPEVQGWVAALIHGPVNRGIGSAPADSQTAAEIDAARRDLVRAGARAAPHLLAVVCDLDFPGTAAAACVGVLSDIGPAALEAVRAAWDWTNEFENDLVRWRLMPFLTRHDPAAALRYALAQVARGERYRTVAYFAEHKPPAGRDELLRLLDTADVNLRWRCVDVLAAIGGPEVVAAFVKLLDKDSWARKDYGPIPYEGPSPRWIPDGRDYVIGVLAKLKAAEAVPALLRMLDERGRGRAYMGDLIIPMLAEYGGPECVPALTAIASVGPADMGRGAYPRAITEMKAAAADAIRAITARSAAPTSPPAGG